MTATATATTSTTPATSAWVQIDDRTAYRVDADAPNQVTVAAVADDDTVWSPEDQAAIAMALTWHLSGYWEKTTEWSAASGEPDVTSVWRRVKVASLDEASDAEARADALCAALGGRPDVTAEAIELDGVWYVVTTGTGEGIDFAYEPDNIDVDVVSALPVRNVDGDIVSGWDYSDWCSGVSPIETLDVAVAYYMEQGRLLGRTGSCMPVLSKEQVAVLKIARDQAERA